MVRNARHSWPFWSLTFADPGHRATFSQCMHLGSELPGTSKQQDRGRCLCGEYWAEDNFTRTEFRHRNPRQVQVRLCYRKGKVGAAINESGVRRFSYLDTLQLIKKVYREQGQLIERLLR